MNEKSDDLNLPAAVVTRIIKEALPEGCNVSKDTKQALVKAATVFIVYITAQASQLVRDRNKKTITHTDVFKALEIAEFTQFEDTLKEALQRYRTLQNDRDRTKEESNNTEEGKGDEGHDIIMEDDFNNIG